jgi:hypothetical protein
MPGTSGYSRVDHISSNFSIDDADDSTPGYSDVDIDMPSFPTSPNQSLAGESDGSPAVSPMRPLVHLYVLLFGIFLGTVLTSLITLSPSPAPPHSAPFDILYLNATSPPAPLKRLDQSPLLPLLRGFDVQQNQAYCGLASTSTLLNSLLLSTLESFDDNGKYEGDTTYDPYTYATQASIRTDACVNAIIPYTNSPDGISDSVMLPPYGTTLNQIEGVVRCLLPEEYRVEAHPISSDVTRDSFRELLLKNLDSSRVLVNFHRAGLNQRGGGHWSPLAAYDSETDSFLILDVAKYKYPSYYVSTSMLYEAVNTVDDCGTWDWPEAQVDVDVDGDHRDALGCKANYRGVVIVTLL